MRRIKWVDERIDPVTVCTGWYSIWPLLQLLVLLLQLLVLLQLLHGAKTTHTEHMFLRLSVELAQVKLRGRRRRQREGLRSELGDRRRRLTWKQV